MGFIKAFSGAIGGTFADQWKDYYVPLANVPATAVVFPAVASGTDAGRGSNTKGSENVITNGSKIVVPEGVALVTMQDGQITGLITEAGGYEFSSDNQNSKSIFSGDGIISSTISTSWERFKFGGIPASQQLAFYVNLKEIPNNKFGTQSEIHWDDAYLNSQVGAIVRGTYTLKVVDPLLFIKGFVPYQYLQAGAGVFDLADTSNDAANQLFSDVVSVLGSAFAAFASDPSNGNRITNIQSKQVEFGKTLSDAVEAAYGWRSSKGLEITSTAIISIEYDEDSKAALSDVRRADALSGARGNAFAQQALARGVQAAGENGGGAGMAFMGMGMQAGSNMMQGVSQANEAVTNPFINVASQNTENVQPQNVNPQSDPYEELKKAKELLDAGIITEADFEAKKKMLLGI